MEQQAQQNSEGIVMIPPAARSKDPYNIGNSSLEVLRMQVCKMQASKEDVTDCLSYQQDQVLANEVSIIHGLEILGICFSVAAVISISVILIRRMFS